MFRVVHLKNFISIISLCVLLHTACASIECSTPCKEFKGDSFILRLWQLQSSANFTSQDVLDTFLNGFAPNVSVMHGFREYVGAKPVNQSVIAFFNVFDSEEDSKAAQAAALSFKQNGVLNSQIEPLWLDSGTFQFFIHVNDTGKCVSENKDAYLSTRLWKLNSNATMTPTEVISTFLEGFAPTVKDLPGFKEYAGITLESGLIFFYNVFTTEEGAQTANQKAAEFVNNGVLGAQISKFNFQEGPISFDIQCTQPATGM